MPVQPQQSSQDIYNQMLGLTNQMQQYTPANADDVYKDLLAEVDFFRPQYEALRSAEAQAYAAPGQGFVDMETAYGTDPSKGPSAMTRLNSILQNQGRLYSTADTLGDIINVQGGRLKDMSNSVVNVYGQQRQGLQDQYNNLQPLHQAAAERERYLKQLEIDQQRYEDQLRRESEQFNWEREQFNRQMAAQEAAQRQQQSYYNSLLTQNRPAAPQRGYDLPMPGAGYDENFSVEVLGGNQGSKGIKDYYSDNFGKVFNTNLTGGDAWRNRIQGAASLSPAGTLINTINPNAIPTITKNYQNDLGNIFNKDMSKKGWQDRAGSAFNITPAGQITKGIRNIFK